MQQSKIYSMAQAEKARLYPEGEGQYFKCWAPGESGPGTKISRAEIPQALAEGKDVLWISHRCSFCGGPTPCLRQS